MNLRQLLLERISLLHGDAQITQIHKGYSGDSKYIVEKDNQKYLLRTFDYAQYPIKQAEYEALFKMHEYNVKCSRPLEIGSLQEQGIGYMLLTFIEGEEAAEDLPRYTAEKQYRIGWEAGEQLRKIHQYAASKDVAPWYDRKVKKHKRYVKEYRKLDVRIRNDSRLIAFIDDHLSLMKYRPNVFQHDDFHAGNLITRDGRLAGVIDFNRFDWGDPVHDFLKLGFFSAAISVPFSIGQIRGYHRSEEPNEAFWQLYSLYVAMTAISSLVWIKQVKPEETNVMMKMINKVLDDHDDFQLSKPKWYSGG